MTRYRYFLLSSVLQFPYSFNVQLFLSTFLCPPPKPSALPPLCPPTQKILPPPMLPPVNYSQLLHADFSDAYDVGTFATNFNQRQVSSLLCVICNSARHKIGIYNRVLGFIDVCVCVWGYENWKLRICKDT